jgi:hypothetical protein
MSLGQSSITSFFRKNLNPSIPISTSSQAYDESVNSPQPKQSPKSTASVAPTPAMDKPHDKKLRHRVLYSSKVSDEKCENVTVTAPAEDKVSTYPSRLSASQGRVTCSAHNKKMRGESANGTGHDIPVHFPVATESDVSERRLCRRATRLIGSMQEESSESEGDAQSLGSDDEIPKKSCATRTAKASSGGRKSRRTKTPVTNLTVPDPTSLVGEVDHLRYKKPDLNTPKSSFQKERLKSECQLLVPTVCSVSKNSEDSPVLERMRQFKEKSDQKAEAELWTALSQIEEEMEDESKSSKLESLSTSTMDKADKDPDLAESTYELERLENIRCDETLAQYSFGCHKD